jgi:predicted RNase H-like HicB family nuclease
VKLGAIIHPAEYGCFWSEVPSLPGCVSQGSSLEEIVANTHNAARMWLSYLREKAMPIADTDDVVVTIEID